MEFTNLIDDIKKYYENLEKNISESKMQIQKYYYLYESLEKLNKSDVILKDLKWKIDELDKLCIAKKEYYTSVDTALNDLLQTLSSDTEENNKNHETPLVIHKCSCEGNLYQPDSGYNTIEKICCIKSDSIFDFAKCKSFLEFLNDHPIIKKFLYGIETSETVNDMFFTFKIVECNDYDPIYVINTIKILLNFHAITAVNNPDKTKKNIAIITLALYNYVMASWTFCESNNGLKFKSAVIKKWHELVKDESVFVQLNRDINPYFDEWDAFIKNESKTLV
jgi:hypothetical protein